MRDIEKEKIEILNISFFLLNFGLCINILYLKFLDKFDG